MRIVCISDTHSKHQLSLPDGDMVIHAGDISRTGSSEDVVKFLVWFRQLPYKHKVFIAGNHDFLFERYPHKALELVNAHGDGIVYLEQSYKVIDGIKIYGSPYTPAFFNWAFQLYGDDGLKLWQNIPLDTNILITHGPPRGILDRTDRGDVVGCPDLANRIPYLTDLKLHIFGHIHEASGVFHSGKTWFCNASVLDSGYNYYDRQPFVIEL